MSRKLIALAVAVVAVAFAACGGNYNSGGTATSSSSALVPALSFRAELPNGDVKTGKIGEELPSEGLGRVNDSYWSAMLGGFTQQTYSQALGFPPKTKITLTNLSGSISHTLDVVQKISGPPAKFPASPNLPVSAKGNGKLKIGYASGPITAGKSVTLTLVKAGIYLIGCAFHYKEGMQDVLVVKAKATPGPQATPPAR